MWIGRLLFRTIFGSGYFAWVCGVFDSCFCDGSGDEAGFSESGDRDGFVFIWIERGTDSSDCQNSGDRVLVREFVQYSVFFGRGLLSLFGNVGDEGQGEGSA